MTDAALIDIGWELRARISAHCPAPLAKPAADLASPPRRTRAPSAEGPPTWRCVLGRFKDGLRPRLWS